MFFASDNTSGVAPGIMAALQTANDSYQRSYGADVLMDRATKLVREVLEAPEAAVYLVATGTAANSLAIALTCPPWGSAFWHQDAHVAEDECGAPEFFSGGGKLRLLPGFGAKVDSAAFESAVAGKNPDFVHETPLHVVSLTNLTECGMAYRPDEIAAFAARAKDAGLAVHLDGARFANALVGTGATPAEMSWKAGVDVLTLGLTKTGAAGCEIILLFGAARAKIQEPRTRAKRSGHMAPKMRFLAAQAEAMLSGGLWLDLAAHANAMARALCAGFESRGFELAYPCDGNEVFVRLPVPAAEKLKTAGAAFYPWPGGSSRFVCSWATQESEVAALLDAV